MGTSSSESVAQQIVIGQEDIDAEAAIDVHIIDPKENGVIDDNEDDELCWMNVKQVLSDPGRPNLYLVGSCRFTFMI
jgi:hypothetical protein